MPLEQRTLITKDMVRHTLATSAKRDIIMISIIFVPVLIFFSFMAMIVSRSANIWFVPAIFAALYVIAILYMVFFAKGAKRGEFRFLKDTVQGLAEKDHFVYNGRHRIPQSSIYFSRCGRAVISARQLSLHSVGDECLLVIADDRKETILAYYNLKYYRTEEWDG